MTKILATSSIVDCYKQTNTVFCLGSDLPKNKLHTDGIVVFNTLQLI